MKRKTQIPLAAAGLVYALFAAACFRLANEHGYERAVSVGEGSFALLGAAGLVAASRLRWQAAAVAIGTVPLVGCVPGDVLELRAALSDRFALRAAHRLGSPDV